MATSKRLNILWAAGLYEGEGSISLSTHKQGTKRYKYPVIDVGSTDRDVLEEFARIVGAGRIYGPYNTVHRDGIERKDMYHWKVTGAAAVRVAQRLRPYVNGRRGKQIDRVLAAKHGRQ